ncbi:arylalkylamine N-acetyltransferase-like 2 [Battus philenor]|uniref:arylalkylamine N-acetyltransferase-like 2 n=1 Tax=Battus philenor TaxID=42288 RepID=UPI0035D0F456
MVFTRPSSVPYPTVWHRFTVRRNSTTISLRVQDLTEDKFDEALALLSKHFTRDEPPCKYIGINNYPTAVAELENLWRKTMKDKLSVICVEDKDDGSSVLVGVNVLTVASKDDKEEPFKTEDKIWAKLFGAVDLVGRSVNIFERYGVDKYLNAYGLVVAPEWRGCHIGKEILKARIPICKALGIKVTATVFTAAASQAVAKKAGFVDLFEITYEELAQKGFVFPGVEKDTKSSKLMALTIN